MSTTKPTAAEQFTALCAPYSGMVYRHCLHMLKSHHDAEDAAQESMLRAFRSFGSFRGKGVASWLFRIAHNTCLDVLKSARHKRESVIFDDENSALSNTPDPSATPEERYESDARDEALWKAVSALPGDQQTLLSLYYGDGLSYQELSRALGLREGTVKSKLSRAKAALRSTLGADAP